MKIQPVNSLGRFVVQKQKRSSRNIERPFPSPSQDIILFGMCVSRYFKKYSTLPDEIKKILSPKDAVDMFINIESIQKGLTKGVKVGQGNGVRVYENPWLKDYYFLIAKEPNIATQTVYSRYQLGNVVWGDSDNKFVQLIKKAQTA